MKTTQNYYLGLDIGTDSIGYAVTDEQYNLKKFHGEPAWGVMVFDAGELNDQRRSFRSARRRLDRRKQRVDLLQELFATEIAKVDPKFYLRMQESTLFRDDVDDEFVLFNDENYTDKDYFTQYPTIHHLIVDLMENKQPHDVRLVYLACAWLVAHRGHFLSNLDKNNLSALKDFSEVYETFMLYFDDNEKEQPWQCDTPDAIGDILKKKAGVNAKNKELINLLYGGKKPSKEATDEFPFNREAIVKLLAGGKVALKDLYLNDAYAEAGSVSLDMDDEKFGAAMAELGEDYDLLALLRSMYDWSVLADVLGEYNSISQAKVAVYNQHKQDLADLKYMVRTYAPDKYDDVFRKIDKGEKNYPAYVKHSDEAGVVKSANKEDFSKFIAGVVGGMTPATKDEPLWNDIKDRLALRTFLPKQKTTDNRVIPHQLYWLELNTILTNTEQYLPFIAEIDEDGLTVHEKVLSIFLFKIPYFVGPLNSHSERAWLKREEGKIYPWNFEKMVDLDASEQNFIQKLTNKCTYLPGEPVLPKSSLAYQKYMVLNEINNIRINGERISVELKQAIYREVFAKKKKVSRKYLADYLIANNVIAKGEEDTISGIDITINSSLTSHIGFARLLEAGVLTEADVEKIIERASYAEDKTRLAKWLEKMYPQIEEADRKYICNLKLKDFGRLSHKFLCELEGADKETGELFTILGAMWNTQNNLMELLSERFTFMERIEAERKKYYAENPQTLSDRLDDMYVSNSVKRQIYRTLDIVKDVTKAFGAPKKIFIEMARGGAENQKGKRTLSRKQQILDLYDKCKEEDVRLLRQQLEEMGEYANNKLQGDKLFLYYMQLGKCMYSGKPIDLEKLATKEYDIDHIYPQAYVKDDSIINNKVLCLSEINGEKSDTYPLKADIRSNMRGYWDYLKHVGLISDEKFKRLTRGTPFTDEERYGFISRQLTETSQSTKAVAELLKDFYPDAEIVYSKARLVSEFRQEFELYKSRTFNDLHHAVDAYLNIVTGNVYNMKFTRSWVMGTPSYSIKTRTLFTREQKVNGKTIWNGEEMLAKVKKTAVKNNAHFTKYAFFKKGGLFDQMPVAAAEGLVPRKKGLPTEKYGGYNKAGAMFYIPVRYKAGKKSEVIIMSVELLHGDRFLKDREFAVNYSYDRLQHILGKPVDEVSFPMGMRPWKVNTVLSLDGFRVCISGIGGGGKTLLAQPIMQYSAEAYWQYYLKKLEMFVEKTSNNASYIYDETYDKITKEENEKLYRIYIDKYTNSIFRKRINAPIEILKNGFEKFNKLDIKEQAKVLLIIHQTFGRKGAPGLDLSSVGGGTRAGATANFSSTVSNWKKNYSNVHIVDISPSGLWEKHSENLLELL